MALQIAPIKASRRKILAGLNEPYYTKTQKSRESIHIGGDKGRRKLVNPAAARKIASQKTRRQLKRAESGPTSQRIIDYKRGKALKKGIESLARAADDVTEEQRAKLHAMDEGKLDEMYQSNDLIFEVYFQYGMTSEGFKTLNDKNADVQFLINQYEARYGPIEV